MTHRSRLPRAVRLSVIAVLVLASALGIVSCAADSAGSASSTKIVLFEPGAGSWAIATLGQAKPGSEIYLNEHLYRLDDSGKAQIVPGIDAAKLFEADRPSDAASRRPGHSDVVQVLDKDQRFVSHKFFADVQPGCTVRFQGKVYSVGAGRALADAVESQPAASKLQRIELNDSALRHILDRHTSGGTMTAGKSVFNSNENLVALIRNAQLLAPVPQSAGNCQRVFEAGRAIGIDRATGKPTSTYSVITTQSGKLVTAFPGLP
jgi:hypothetical protein